MKISFIVPAYNTSKTIERTLESIINQEQTLLDYEIIVVNDGSPDNIKEAVLNYKDKIKYYEKENGGLSDARNYGVKKSQGEYIIFVDSDDYVSKTLLKDIQDYVKKGVDLIKWEPVIVDEEEKVIKKCSANSFDETSGENGFNQLFGTDPLMVCVWDYAIKRDILIDFPVGTFHEDFAVMPLMILKAKSMVITGENEYYYVQTDDSIMRGNDSEKQRKRLEDTIVHFENLIDKTQKMNIDKKTKENVGIFGANSLLVNIPELDEENKKFFADEIKKRNISQYIKARNIKQLIKKIVLMIKY